MVMDDRNQIAILTGCLAMVLLPACGPSQQGEATPAREKPFAVKTHSGVDMIFVPGGTFRMGSDEADPDEAPAHEVTVVPFVIDQFEVSHDQFKKHQLPNPSHWQDDPRKPVEQVRWRDAKLFCNERSLAEGLTPCYDEALKGWPCNFEANGYRLPTEAEWEYAARAGSGDSFPMGAKSLRQSSWHATNAGEKTHVVGTRRPNAWGIHDLHGNVSEWCQDVYQEDYYRQSPGDNPRGPLETPETTRRVMRGGSWKSSPEMCRVTFRQGQQTGDSDACFYTDFCGFRCVRSITVQAAKDMIQGKVTSL
jgi:formylglycine-generating enzyme